MGILVGKVVDYKNGNVFVKLSDNVNVHDGVRIIGVNDIGFNIDKMFINGKSVSKASRGDVVSFKSSRVKIGSILIKTTDYVQINDINNNINSKSRKVFISGLIKLIKNENIYLELCDGVNNVCVKGSIVEASRNFSISRSQVVKQIDRLGGTVFCFDKLDVIMSDDIFVPVSVLNNLRRKAISLLEEKRIYNTNYFKSVYNINVPDFPKVQEHSCLINNKSDYNSSNYDYVYVDNFDLFNSLSNVYYRIPRVNNDYKNINSRVLVCEFGSLYKYSNVDTDFSFNVVNSYSVAFLHSIGVKKITLSYELDLFRVKNIIDSYHHRYKCHPNLEVIISACEEVMISKYNILDFYGIDSGSLRDRFGNLYPIKFFNDLTYIYNYKKRELNPLDYFNIGINVVRNNF